jgi:hypothetical protein
MDQFLNNFEFPVDIHLPLGLLLLTPDADNISLLQGTNSTPVPEAASGVTIDDIQTEYHHHSGRKFHIEHFDNYNHKEESTHNDFIPLKKPWYPFQTCLDFEVADLILETAMNAKQIVALISLFQHSVWRNSPFTAITICRKLGTSHQ